MTINIILIRSANEEVFEKLIKYVNIKYKNDQINLYCLIQKSLVKNFKKKYPNFNCIEKDDGFFEYNQFKRNLKLIENISNNEFDELYIPSSYIDYPDFNDVFMISCRIKNKKTILFNCNEETIEKKFNFILLWIDNYLGDIIYFIKILFALIKIVIIYALYYPYNFIKDKLISNKFNNKEVN